MTTNDELLDLIEDYADALVYARIYEKQAEWFDSHVELNRKESQHYFEQAANIKEKIKALLEKRNDGR